MGSQDGHRPVIPCFSPFPGVPTPLIPLEVRRLFTPLSLQSASLLIVLLQATAVDKPV